MVQKVWKLSRIQRRVTPSNRLDSFLLAISIPIENSVTGVMDFGDGTENYLEKETEMRERRKVPITANCVACLVLCFLVVALQFTQGHRLMPRWRLKRWCRNLRWWWRIKRLPPAGETCDLCDQVITVCA